VARPVSASPGRPALWGTRRAGKASRWSTAGRPGCLANSQPPAVKAGCRACSPRWSALACSSSTTGGPEPLIAEQRRDLLEIVEDRYEKGSLLITSQVPVARWHELVGDPTIGDAILDRVVHRAHRIELKGPSLRKRQAVVAAAEGEAAAAAG